MRFRDRTEGGRQLASLLARFAGEHPVVLGLARGGVEVAAPVADALGAPLEALIARKLGAPLQPELAMGAISENGVLWIAEDIAQLVLASHHEIVAAVQRERGELARQIERYRRGRALAPCGGCTVVLVDDGVATGGTARAAIRAARSLGARRVVFAVPVGGTRALEELRHEADEVVCARPIEELRAVGDWYQDFGQVTDAHVLALLEARRRHLGPPLAHGGGAGVERSEVRVRAAGSHLDGMLEVPVHCRGLVLIVDGRAGDAPPQIDGPTRAALHDCGLATLCVDLRHDHDVALDDEGEHHHVDIATRASRLIDVASWASGHPTAARRPIGWLAMRAGVPAALCAAGLRPDLVGALVCKSGRPDRAGSMLPLVDTPTLLIAGGDDLVGVGHARVALAALRCSKRLDVVPGASREFPEPGARAQLAELCAEWFTGQQGLVRGAHAEAPR